MANRILVVNGPNLNLLGTREPANAGALTHTQASRCAMRWLRYRYALSKFISHPHRRETFRHRSYLSDLAVGTIVGLGGAGYRYALEFAVNDRGSCG